MSKPRLQLLQPPISVKTLASEKAEKLHLGDQVLAEARAALSDQWDRLTPEHKAIAMHVATDLVKLHALSLAGLNMDEEAKHIKAQIMVLSEQVRLALIDAFLKVVFNVGKIVGALLKGVILGAL